MNLSPKSQVLKTSINLLNEKLHFEGTVEGNPTISIDYIPPFGDNLGYTSLELLLLSLSSCVGSSVLLFLRKMQKEINGLVINTTGIRKEEHPTGFKTIVLEIHLKTPNTTEADFQKVLKMTEDTYCPVWSMLKGNVDIEIKTIIEC